MRKTVNAKPPFGGFLFVLEAGIETPHFNTFPTPCKTSAIYCFPNIFNKNNPLQDIKEIEVS